MGLVWAEEATKHKICKTSAQLIVINSKSQLICKHVFSKGKETAHINRGCLLCKKLDKLFMATNTIYPSDAIPKAKPQFIIDFVNIKMQ